MKTYSLDVKFMGHMLCVELDLGVYNENEERALERVKHLKEHLISFLKDRDNCFPIPSWEAGQ